MKQVRMVYTMPTAKIFANGRSQAVRLPKAFRFATKEVWVRREGEAIVLEPVKKPAWPRGFWERVRVTDRAFRRPEQGRMPLRRALDSSR